MSEPIYNPVLLTWQGWELWVKGYIIAVNLPEAIRPQISERGKSIDRYDIVGYVGDFPEAVRELWWHAEMESVGAVLYLRKLDKDATCIEACANEYTLEVPTCHGEENATGLAPVYIGRKCTPVLIGRPEIHEWRDPFLQDATYIVCPCMVGDRRAYEILCLTSHKAQEVAEGVAQGNYTDLLRSLRIQTAPLSWQASNSDFINWYNATDIHR